MPILPSGHIVGITSERARYHAVRRNIYINKNTPHQDLYKLVDIIYANASDDSNPWQKGYRFTGYTVSDKQWLKKWKSEDRDSFLEWIKQSNAFQEIEGARNKVIYDNLPQMVRTFDYPERLYSMLQRRIAAISMSIASPNQWRNTILNMKHCGVREEELKWSGVIAFLEEAEASGRGHITRDELLTRIDFSNIRLELVNELVREEMCWLNFEGMAEIISPDQYFRSGLKLGVNEYAVLRYSDPQLNYRIAYIRSQERGSLCARRWVVLDPFGRALTSDCEDCTIYYDDIASAKQAASSHAQHHYGLKNGLHHGNKYEYMSLHGGKDYREWIVTLPDYQQSHFTSHFTERNVLLHMRTKTRHDSEGNRLLFIEEIQSDWHQQHTHKGRTSRWGEKIPDAPFRKEWPLLAIKLLLQHVVEEEYDGIAWTPGDIQQMHFQSDIEWLLRLYDRVIPQHLLQLSRDWGGAIEKRSIKTKQPWLAPRRSGDYWSVSDGEGRFATRNRLSKLQAIVICERHNRMIDLAVPVFYIPVAMREKIDHDALPLFGEMMVDKVKKPLCGEDGFKECDAQTKSACMLEL